MICRLKKNKFQIGPCVCVQEGVWRSDASSPERLQRQSRFSHQQQAARSLLQLQHGVWHGPASQRLPLRPPALPDPRWTPAEPQRQPVLRRLLLHVHCLPLRGPGAGPCWLPGRRFLPHSAPQVGFGLQPLFDLQRPPKAWGGTGLLPRQRCHTRGALHRAGSGGSGQRGADQWAPPAHESDHSQRQEGPQLQSVQHQRGTLSCTRRWCDHVLACRLQQEHWRLLSWEPAAASLPSGLKNQP